MEQNEDYEDNNYNQDHDDAPIRFVEKEHKENKEFKDDKKQKDHHDLKEFKSSHLKNLDEEDEKAILAQLAEEEALKEQEMLKTNDNCSLCKSMGCCPEHCCDWDNCDCGDCVYCHGFAHHKEIGVKIPKKLLRSEDHKEDYYTDPKKDHKLKKHIRIENDTFLITNFEVDEPKEHVEERNGVKIYGGGVRGIRALKQEKEEEEMKEDEKLKKEFIESQGDKFKRFEHKVSKKNRLIIK